MKQQRMFGLWPSPITPRSMAAVLRLGEPVWDTDGRTLGWIEGRSDRGVVVVQEDGGAPRDLTPGDLSVRAFVGYGGGDFTLSHGACYFVAQADQRIYRQELAGGAARPITPSFGAASSPAVSPDGRWVAYVHSDGETDCIAIVDSEGEHWPAKLAGGRDFFMQPTWHPAGDRLAWVEWDQPQMPWDGAELGGGAIRAVAGGPPRLASRGVVAGGPETAIFQPLFSLDGLALRFISDEPGIGQPFERDLTTGDTHRLATTDGDFAVPAWAHAFRRHTVLANGDIVAVENRLGFDRLVRIPAGGGDLEDLSARHDGYSTIAGLVAAPEGARVAFVGSGGKQPPRVVTLDLDGAGPPTVVRRSDGETVAQDQLSAPEAISWTVDGEDVHGLFYPPASDDFESDGLPPVVVIVHGGPTSQVQAGWHAQAQFFATRGYAVLLPNYRGSTGYGRAYMRQLDGNWGIHDVRDSRSGVEALGARGLADPARAVIFGGSAGGYTVLQSLIDFPGFYRAAICMYGVSNQFTLASDTHKFEARYLDTLLGALPAATQVYRERSPLFHADRISDPIAIFQGDIDRVVPRAQSDAIAGSLKARGVPSEYHVYEGEGHGWRKSETIDHYWTTVDRFLREHVIYS